MTSRQSCFSITASTDIDDVLGRIRAAGCICGVALRADTPVGRLTPCLAALDLVLLMGTPLGMKGCQGDPESVGRMKEARALVDSAQKDKILLTADGAIRSNTVPGLYAAGADVITPGSLVFRSPDIGAAFSWLHSLRRA